MSENEATGKGRGRSYYTLPSTERQIVQDLNRSRVYRLADVFFKFLFGKQERSAMFLDLLNPLVFPDGNHSFTKMEFVNTELPSTRIDGKGSRLDVVGILDNEELVNLEV